MNEGVVFVLDSEKKPIVTSGGGGRNGLAGHYRIRRRNLQQTR